MKTTYKVTATTGYDGHAEGEEVELELTPEQEKRAVERGSIKPVHKHEPKKGAKDE